MASTAGLTPEQRYLLDLNGYLFFRNALSPRELASARHAVDRLLREHGEGSDLESESGDGFATGARHAEGGGRQVMWRYSIAFDRCLEAMAFHRAWWPAVLELTHHRPRLCAGDLICDDHRLNTPRGSFLHCAREDWGRESASMRDGVAQPGCLYCDNFVVFPCAHAHSHLRHLPCRFTAGFVVTRPFHFGFLVQVPGLSPSGRWGARRAAWKS